MIEPEALTTGISQVGDKLRARLGRAQLQVDRWLLGSLQRLRFKPLSSMSRATVRNIVIYRVGNIGDIAVALPALRVIRQAFPQARITLLTSSGKPGLPGAADLLAGFPPRVDEIVSYLPAEVKGIKGLNTLKAKLTARGPVDLFIDLPVTLQTPARGLRELFFAHWLGSRATFGFGLALPKLFRTEFCRCFPEAVPKTSDWLLSLLQAEGLGTGKEPPNNGTTVLAENVEAVEAKIKSLGVDWRQRLLVVNAGAKLAIKRWPPERFAEVLARLLQAKPWAQALLIGNVEERDLNATIVAMAESILREPRVRLVNLSGALSLPETLRLIERSDGVFSNDTGTMHLAGLLGKPVVVPMSGQYPAPLWHPPGETLKAFRADASCAPCFREECPLPEQICLTRISSEAVLNALLDIF